MKSERLDNLWRDGVAFDLETHLIQPGLVAPPVVCGSLALMTNEGIKGEILDRVEARGAFAGILRDPRRTLIGAHIAFDVICEIVDFAKHGADIIPEVFAMFDPERRAIFGDVDGRVYDLQVAEQLHAIARGHLGHDPMTGKRIVNPDTGRPGRYSLREVVRQRLGRDNAKANDRFRMSYALLEGTPIAQWPPEARTYPIDDAVNSFETALAQAGHIPSVGPHVWVESTGMGSPPHCSQCGALPGASAECRARYRIQNAHEIARQTYVWFVMDLGGAHGFQVDQAAVNALEAKYHAEHDGKQQPFVDAGIIREDGSEDQSVLKRLVVQAYTAGQQPVSCRACAGTVDKKGRPRPGKQISQVTGNTLVNCDECDGSGLHLPPDVPRSEKGGISKKRDVLNESGDEFLMSYADYDAASKIVDVYIPFLRNTDRDGNAHPGKPLTLRPNPLLETGRTSYDGVIQLLPRTGGVRECIVARPGTLFSSQDYKAGELVTHAQSCLWLVGASRLAEALNRGLDAHLAGAATLLGISYDEALKRQKAGDKQVKDLRQAFKAANFGFPGRMGAAKLVQQKRAEDFETVGPDGYVYKGLRFCILMGAADRCGLVKVTEWKGRPYPPLCKKCIECAESLKKTWLQQWPENEPLFAHVKRIDESGQPVVQHMSKRLRGFKHGQVDENGEPMNSGNAIANGYFQALLADACKNAMLAAVRECYDHTTIVHTPRIEVTPFAAKFGYAPKVSRFEGQRSPLLGSRLIAFQHDEHLLEHPEAIAAEAATRDGEVMELALTIACPDMGPAIEALPTLIRRLYKGAEPTYDASGRLIPWEPKKAKTA